MSSTWTHNICAACWNQKNPDRPAHVILDAEEDWCCFCGKSNKDGIYVRENPGLTPCGGKHDAA